MKRTVLSETVLLLVQCSAARGNTCESYITLTYEHNVRASFSWTRTFLRGYHDSGLELLRQIGKKIDKTY